MCAPVDAAQLAFRLVVTHYGVKAYRFIKSSSSRIIRLRQVLIVDDDFKDRTHGIALLVNESATLGRTQRRCEQCREAQRCQRCGLKPAHRRCLPYWPDKRPNPRL